MGYTTDFEGRFDLDHSLTQEHADYLFAFSDKRRMRRNPEWARRRHDPLRSAVGLPLGSEAGYFVGGDWLRGPGSRPRRYRLQQPSRGPAWSLVPMGTHQRPCRCRVEWL